MKRVHAKYATLGFTLIELMMTVAILAVLAAIAIPNFINYSLRAKSAEAFTLIGSIVTTQETFCAEFENYVEVEPHPAVVPGVRKVPWDVIKCPATCSRQNPVTCNQFDCVGFQSPARVYFQYATRRILAAPGVPPEYAVGASSDLDADGIPGTFAYRSKNYGGLVGLVHDGISHCPMDMFAQSITRCSPVSY